MTKVNLNTLLILGALGFGAVAFITARRAVTQVGGAVIDATNPVNRDNIFNRTANNLTAAISGDKNQTVGGAIFDFFNPTVGLDDAQN